LNVRGGFSSGMALASPTVHRPTPFTERMHMIRLAITLATCLSLVPLASASLAPRKPASPLAREVRQALAAPRAPKVPVSTAQTETRAEFAVTEETEVFLNGKPCRYADVPSHATIERMEVAEDKTTVLKVYFKVRK
jgi:hypothetical protein